MESKVTAPQEQLDRIFASGVLSGQVYLVTEEDEGYLKLSNDRWVLTHMVEEYEGTQLPLGTQVAKSAIASWEQGNTYLLENGEIFTLYDVGTTVRVTCRERHLFNIGDLGIITKLNRLGYTITRNGARQLLTWDQVEPYTPPVTKVLPPKPSRRQYTVSFKLKVLREAQEQGNISAVCRAHGITRSLFYYWREQESEEHFNPNRAVSFSRQPYNTIIRGNQCYM